jgi:isochorismate hydrolase
MLNKNPIEAEIFGSKADPSAAKKEYQILQNFDFEDRYQESGRQQGILCCDFFLVGVLTIEQKIQHCLKKSLHGISSTLFPTVRT